MLFDPYRWERKHYYSRPYPLTGRLGEDIPILGPIVASTLGRIVKPQQIMHREVLEKAMQQGSGQQMLYEEAGIYPRSDLPGQGPRYLPGEFGHAVDRTVPGTLVNRMPTPAMPTSAASTASRMLYRDVIEAGGIRGFALESIWSNVTKSDTLPYQPIAEMADASQMYSKNRMFWDEQLGGLLGTTEGLRRYFPRRRTEWERWNPSFRSS